jgi:hypothetical protein
VSFHASVYEDCELEFRTMYLTLAPPRIEPLPYLARRIPGTTVGPLLFQLDYYALVPKGGRAAAIEDWESLAPTGSL